MRDAIRDIVRSAAAATRSHRKCAAELRRLHPADTEDPTRLSEFCRGLWRSLLPVLRCKRTGNPDADRAVQFLKTYLQALNDENVISSTPVTNYLLKKSLQGCTAKSVSVRYRVCSLVLSVLNQIVDIDEDLYQSVVACMRGRLRDKDRHVRAFAVMCLCRTLDDESAPVLEALLNTMETDPSPEVRRVVIMNVDITPKTVTRILNRMRDVDAKVRRSVLTRFIESEWSSCVNPTVLRLLLQLGYSDRDDRVNVECLTMVGERWWKTECGGDVKKFVAMLDFTGKESERAISDLMKARFISLDVLKKFFSELDWLSITAVDAYFVRVVVGHIAKEKNSPLRDILEHLPTLSEHCSYIEKHFGLMVTSQSEEDQMEHDVVLQQLIFMAEVRPSDDFSADEVGRNCFLEMAQTLMLHFEFPAECISSLLGTVYNLISEDEFILTVTEIVAEISSNSVAKVAGDLEAENHEAMCALMSLEILKAALQLIEKNIANSEPFKFLLHRFILPGARSENTTIRQVGIHCLALCCILDPVLAKENSALFLLGFEVNDPDLHVLIMQIMTDLTIIHQGRLMDPATVATHLKSCLNVSHQQLLTVTVESSAKLLRGGNILPLDDAACIIEALIVLYYHPLTKQYTRLRQCLSFFLPWFSLASHENQMLIAEGFAQAFIDLMKIEIEVEPLDVPLIEVARQIIEWTDDSNRKVKLPPDTLNPHYRIATRILEEVNADPDIAKAACAIMPQLTVVCGDQLSRDKLKTLATRIKMIVSGDAASTKALKAFIEPLMDGGPRAAVPEKGDGVNDDVEAGDLSEGH